MTRRAKWTTFQWAVGILNAYGAIDCLVDGSYLGFAASTLCVFITARWKMDKIAD